MKVIFIQNVKKKGQRGEVKEINEGFARNFLLPNKLAVEATPQAIRDAKNKEDGLAIKKEKHSKAFQETLTQLQDFTLVMKKRANDEGHLFSGIAVKEIITALKEKGIHLEEKHLSLFSPIKKIGAVELALVKSPETKVKINIEKE